VPSSFLFEALIETLKLKNQERKVAAEGHDHDNAREQSITVSKATQIDGFLNKYLI